MVKIKNCPFCDKELEKRSTFYVHVEQSCILRNHILLDRDVVPWNKRVSPNINDRLLTALKVQHHWQMTAEGLHMDYTDSDAGIPSLDISGEYFDTDMYDKTVEAIFEAEK